MNKASNKVMAKKRNGGKGIDLRYFSLGDIKVS